MKTISLENFKAIRDKTSFDIADITALIGPNNSGKSSLLDLIQILKSNENKGSFPSKLVFENTNGFFAAEKIIHKYCTEKQFSFSINHYLLGDEVEFTYKYIPDSGSPIGSATLSEFSIFSRDTAKVVYQCNRDEEKNFFNPEYFSSQLLNYLDTITLSALNNSYGYGDGTKLHQKLSNKSDLILSLELIQSLGFEIIETSKLSKRVNKFLAKEISRSNIQFKILLTRNAGKILRLFETIDTNEYENYEEDQKHQYVAKIEELLIGTIQDEINFLLYEGFADQYTLQELETVDNFDCVFSLFFNQILTTITEYHDDWKESYLLGNDNDWISQNLQPGLLTKEFASDAYELLTADENNVTVSSIYTRARELDRFILSLIYKARFNSFSSGQYESSSWDTSLHTNPVDYIFPSLIISSWPPIEKGTYLLELINDLPQLSIKQKLFKSFLERIFIGEGIALSEGDSELIRIWKEVNKNYGIDEIHCNSHFALYNYLINISLDPIQHPLKTMNFKMLNNARAQKLRQGINDPFISNWLVHEEDKRKFIGPFKDISECLRIFNIDASLDFEAKHNSKITLILKDKNGHHEMDELGYGLSQLINMILYLTIDVSGNKVVYIEEPESNLHPDFQSKLADLFVWAINKKNCRIILETHSEYLVRKLQVLVARGDICKEKAALYYFNTAVEDEKDKVVKINFDDDGSLSKPFGQGFFDESSQWRLELLRLNKVQKN